MVPLTLCDIHEYACYELHYITSLGNGKEDEIEGSKDVQMNRLPLDVIPSDERHQGNPSWSSLSPRWS